MPSSVLYCLYEQSSARISFWKFCSFDIPLGNLKHEKCLKKLRDEESVLHLFVWDLNFLEIPSLFNVLNNIYVSLPFKITVLRARSKNIKSYEIKHYS